MYALVVQFSWGGGTSFTFQTLTGFTNSTNAANAGNALQDALSSHQMSVTYKVVPVV